MINVSRIVKMEQSSVSFCALSLDSRVSLGLIDGLIKGKVQQHNKVIQLS